MQLTPAVAITPLGWTAMQQRLPCKLKVHSPAWGIVVNLAQHNGPLLLRVSGFPAGGSCQQTVVDLNGQHLQHIAAAPAPFAAIPQLHLHI